MSEVKLHDSLGRKAHSWIVTSKDTGLAVLETFDVKTAQRIDTEHYAVTPAYDYLCALNAKIKENPYVFTC